MARKRKNIETAEVIGHEPEVSVTPQSEARATVTRDYQLAHIGFNVQAARSGTRGRQSASQAARQRVADAREQARLANGHRSKKWPQLFAQKEQPRDKN